MTKHDVSDLCLPRPSNIYLSLSSTNLLFTFISNIKLIIINGVENFNASVPNGNRFTQNLICGSYERPPFPFWNWNQSMALQLTDSTRIIAELFPLVMLLAKFMMISLCLLTTEKVRTESLPSTDSLDSRIAMVSVCTQCSS